MHALICSRSLEQLFILTQTCAQLAQHSLTDTPQQLEHLREQKHSFWTLSVVLTDISGVIQSTA